MQRQWYCPWCNPVPVWREVGVNRISISVELRYFGSSDLVLLPIQNFSATSTASVVRSGTISGMRSTVRVTIGGWAAAQTSAPIVVTEGDI
jgi:hypothetical protein